MEAGALPGTSGSHYQSDGHFEKDKNVEKPGSLSENYRAYFDEDNKLKFYPPLYKQRYEAVQEILRDGRWSPPVATVRLKQRQSKILFTSCSVVCHFLRFLSHKYLERGC